VPYDELICTTKDMVTVHLARSGSVFTVHHSQISKQCGTNSKGQMASLFSYRNYKNGIANVECKYTWRSHLVKTALVKHTVKLNDSKFTDKDNIHSEISCIFYTSDIVFISYIFSTI